MHALPIIYGSSKCLLPHEHLGSKFFATTNFEPCATVSNTDFGLFGDDTAVSRCDTDLRQITEKQFMNICVAKQNM